MYNNHNFSQPVYDPARGREGHNPQSLYHDDRDVNTYLFMEDDMLASLQNTHHDHQAYGNLTAGNGTLQPPEGHSVENSGFSNMASIDPVLQYSGQRQDFAFPMSRGVFPVGSNVQPQVHTIPTSTAAVAMHHQTRGAGPSDPSRGNPYAQSSCPPNLPPAPSKKTRRRRNVDPLPPDTQIVALHNSKSTFDCEWYGSGPGLCLQRIGVKKSEVQKHFLHHFPELENKTIRSEEYGRLVKCTWGGPAGQCGVKVKLSSLGNHISGVHTKSVAFMCNLCGRVLARKDVAVKHYTSRTANGTCPEQVGRAGSKNTERQDNQVGPQ